MPPAEQTDSIILSTVTPYCVYLPWHAFCLCHQMPYGILKPERVITDDVLLYALEKNLCALMLREETEVWRPHGL